ncbi:MAG: hypothetical protein ACRC1K_20000 [Planctomycetia bacterium]
MTYRRSAIFVLTLAATAAFTAAGCGSGGPPLGRVYGKVTLDGQPLPGADVAFIPPKGAIAFAETGSDGTYTLQYVNRSGALVGPAKVSVNGNNIPKKYNTETELNVEVKSGSNTFDFDLKSK